MSRKQQNETEHTTATSYLHFEGAIEAHVEFSTLVLCKHPLEGLLEKRRVERVPHDNEATVPVSAHSSRLPDLPCVIGKVLHLVQSSLVECACVDVNDVTVLCHTLGKSFVVLPSSQNHNNPTTIRGKRVVPSLLS